MLQDVVNIVEQIMHSIPFLSYQRCDICDSSKCILIKMQASGTGEGEWTKTSWMSIKERQLEDWVMHGEQADDWEDGVVVLVLVLVVVTVMVLVLVMVMVLVVMVMKKMCRSKSRQV